MVSTRQMTNVGGPASSSDESESSTARPQRQNSVITIVSTYTMQNSADASNLPSSSNSYVPPSSISLLDMPHEIIEKILVYVGYKKIAQMRLVCRQMNQTCSSILNSTFSRLQTQMLSRFQSIKSKMPRRESARRSHPLACESDIVETLHMRLTLLQMTFGKHIERRHCCFFPGEILDEVYRILHYIRVTQKLARPYKVTDELFDLSTMAMEYFKERIEPALPEIAYFGTDFLDFTGTFSAGSVSKSYLCLEDGSHENDPTSPPPSAPLPPSSPSMTPQNSSTHNNNRRVHDLLTNCDLVEVGGGGSGGVMRGHAGVLPQSNMVLRKRIRKIKQGMKRYNTQLSVLRNDLRNCKRKTAEQQRQISEQQKQLAEQQKQTLEYATRLDENDKKNEETSRKFSTLLQELNKCKTELQYWRSKSPATPLVCNGCGVVVSMNQEDLKALVNQGVKPEDVCIDFNDLQSANTTNDINNKSNEINVENINLASLTNSTEGNIDENEATDDKINSEKIKGLKRKIAIDENEVVINSTDVDVKINSEKNKGLKRKIVIDDIASSSNSTGKKLRRGLNKRSGKVRNK